MSPMGSFLDLNIDLQSAKEHKKRVLFVPNTKKCMICSESFMDTSAASYRNCGKCICHSAVQVGNSTVEDK